MRVAIFTKTPPLESFPRNPIIDKNALSWAQFLTRTKLTKIFLLICTLPHCYFEVTANMYHDKINWIQTTSVGDFIHDVIKLVVWKQNLPMVLYIDHLLLTNLRIEISTRMNVHEINALDQISLIGLKSFEDLLDHLKNLYIEAPMKSIAVCSWFCYDPLPKNQLYMANSLFWHLHTICDYTKLHVYIRIPPFDLRYCDPFWVTNLEFPEYSQLKIITSRYAYLPSSVTSSSLESSSSPSPPKDPF